MSIFTIRKTLAAYSGWVIALGALNILLGALALVFSGAFTLVSVTLFGLLLSLSGISEIALGVRLRAEGGMWFHLLMGTLTAVVGMLVYLNPIENAVVLTMLIALLLFVGGIVKIVGSLADRGPHWGRFAINGVVSVALAGIIYSQWPNSAIWVIGTFVGCDLLVFGFVLTSLGLAARKHQKV